MAQNRLDELPLGLSDMNKLQILKVAGNPLRPSLQRLLEAPDADVTSSAMTDNEKEVALTAELKRFLKTKQPVTTPESEIRYGVAVIHLRGSPELTCEV